MISQTQFIESAQSLKIHPAVLAGIIHIESGNRGFWQRPSNMPAQSELISIPDNVPVVLFERHVFARLTDNKYTSSHPTLSSITPGGYATGRTLAERGIREYLRILQAAQLNEDAAISAASWGVGQVLGRHWKLVNTDSPAHFRSMMEESEARQLEIVVRFLERSGILTVMQRPINDQFWTTLAGRYNGRNYATHRYHTRLREASEKYARDWQLPLTK